MRNRGPARFDNRQGYITVHPSYLLRLPDADARREAFDAFTADLVAIRDLAA
jgi:DNA polymerase